MEDLRMLDRMGRVLDPLVPDVPEGAWRRVNAAIATPARDARPARSPRPAWTPRRRLVLAAGLAAVLTVGGLAGQTVRWGNRPPASTANAAIVLRDAAQAASRQPDLAPRPDQFVFIESIAVFPVGGGADGPLHYALTRSQRWISADGSRAGLGRFRAESDPGGWREKSQPPEVGYPKGLPTDPDAMLRYLETHPAEMFAGVPAPTDPYDRALITFTSAEWLLESSYLPPAVAAAVFEAMSRIPGTDVMPDAVDAAGRHGIGVRMADHGDGSDYVVFDRHTHELLGTQLPHGTGGPAGPPDADRTALLRIAVVDRPGQLP